MNTQIETTSEIELTALQPRLMEQFMLVVPGVSDPSDLEAIRSRLLDGPCPVAFREGGIVPMAGFKIPVRKVELAELVIQSVQLDQEGLVGPAVAIRLPLDLARVQAAWERSQNANDKTNVDYDWELFFKQYQEDLGQSAGHLLRNWVMATRLNGLMAQAVSDVRLAENEVGLGVETARQLQKLLAREVDPAIGELESLEGLMIILERFPTASSEGARACALRILADRPEKQTFVNPKVWQLLQGGDEDGDLAHNGTTEKIEFGPSREVGPFPAITTFNGAPVLDTLVLGWAPVTPEAAVTRVMGMCIKDLTGLLHHTFHCVSRAAAVNHALKYDPSEQKARIKSVYTRIFDEIYFELIESVMDAKKTDGSLDNLYGLAEGLQEGVDGGVLKPICFAPFVPEEKRALLIGMLKLAGNSIGTTRQTGFGRAVAAGQWLTKPNKKKGTPPQAVSLISTILDQGIPVEQVIERLQQDALGERLLILNRPRRNSGEKNEFEGAADGAGGDRSLDWKVSDPFALTWRDKQVMRVLKRGVDKKNGRPLIQLEVVPRWWKGQSDLPAWWVMLELPVTRVVGADGHQVVKLGPSERFFRPIWTLEDGEVVLWDLERSLTEALKLAVVELSKRKGKMTQARVELALQKAIRAWVNNLPLSNEKEKLIRRFQFEVDTRVSDDQGVQAKWDVLEKILKELSLKGFDVLSTSKNKPGAYVMKAEANGLPSYLQAINPFARYLDPKRRVEPLEIRQSLDLFSPTELSVSLLGKKLPAVLQRSVVELIVAIFDCNLNRFDDGKGGTFCHDTLIGCPSIVERIALAGLDLVAEDEFEKDRIVADLMEEGIGIDAIEVTPEPVRLGEGLTKTQFRVTVRCKITDIGKLKSCVGPVKGIPNVIPIQLFADGKEIDLVIPRDTVLRKKALDLVLYLLAAKKGITKVDPTLELADLVALLGPEELTEIKDKEGNVLGKALVGKLPFFRPNQTGRSQFALRAGRRGVKIHTHAMIMAGIGYATPAFVNEEFVQIVSVMQQAAALNKKEGDLNLQELNEMMLEAEAC
jgi:hypothetical protein